MLLLSFFEGLKILLQGYSHLGLLDDRGGTCCKENRNHTLILHLTVHLIKSQHPQSGPPVLECSLCHFPKTKKPLSPPLKFTQPPSLTEAQDQFHSMRGLNQRLYVHKDNDCIIHTCAEALHSERTNQFSNFAEYYGDLPKPRNKLQNRRICNQLYEQSAQGRYDGPLHIDSLPLLQKMIALLY